MWQQVFDAKGDRAWHADLLWIVRTRGLEEEPLFAHIDSLNSRKSRWCRAVPGDARRILSYSPPGIWNVAVQKSAGDVHNKAPEIQIFGSLKMALRYDAGDPLGENPDATKHRLA